MRGSVDTDVLREGNAARAAAAAKPGAEEAVEVSVVIPCLNEANSIGICISKAMGAFGASALRGEVIVADNGSTDGSIEIAEKLGARPGITPDALRGAVSRVERSQEDVIGRRERRPSLGSLCAAE